jgi:hypothetical protein
MRHLAAGSHPAPILPRDIVSLIASAPDEHDGQDGTIPCYEFAAEGASQCEPSNILQWMCNLCIRDCN